MVSSGAAPAHVLKLVRDPGDLGWPPRGAGTAGAIVGVIGWTLAETVVDAGVPPAVAGVLAEALCRCGQVSFLDPAGPATLAPPALKRLAGKPRFPVMTTADPQAAARLFDVDAFPWDQGGQVALLTAPGTAPALDYADLFELWSEPSPALDRLARKMRAAGFLFPGPDGDFAEIVVFEEALWDRLKQALAEACDGAGCLWQEVSEEAFLSSGWVGSG